MSVERSWQRIARWFGDNAPPSAFRVNPGASPEAVADLERAIGAALPRDFRESLLLHDGGEDLWLLPTHGELMSAAGILARWRWYRDLRRTDGYADPEDAVWTPTRVRGPIEPYFWGPRRLFVSDNSGDHITLDLDPPAGGCYGQVLYHSHEVGPEEVLAPGWLAYLDLVADELQSGRYAYDDRDGCIVDRAEEA